MNENVKFYKCPICGNVIGLIDGNAEHLRCCGQEMELLVANTQDASQEKHVPVYEHVDGEIVVKVGAVDHPMTKEHYIMWIAQVTEDRVTRVNLKPGDDVIVKFPYISNSVIYAYCNLHGLWKKEVK